MADNVYERINQVLTWKRVLAFNFVLFLVLVIPLSVRLSQMDTENRSNAATEDVIAKSPIPLPNYPKAPPIIHRVNSFYGKVGDAVVIIGKNFGDYKWGSKVYVGNVEATDKEVIRWSDNILEVQIPEGARTGSVWVSINGQEARWQGSLVLYDVARAAKVGFRRLSQTQAAVTLEKAERVARGMVEFSYVSEPVSVTPVETVAVRSQTPTLDALGKKMQVEFEVMSVLPRSTTDIFVIDYPGIGEMEIVRAELYDAGGNLLEVFSDPLSVKLFVQ